MGKANWHAAGFSDTEFRSVMNRNRTIAGRRLRFPDRTRWLARYARLASVAATRSSGVPCSEAEGGPSNR